MSKPLTVRQMRNRFQKLVDQGYGNSPVISESMNAVSPRIREGDLRYIGPSQWDSHEYALYAGDGKVVIL